MLLLLIYTWSWRLELFGVTAVTEIFVYVTRLFFIVLLDTQPQQWAWVVSASLRSWQPQCDISCQHGGILICSAQKYLWAEQKYLWAETCPFAAVIGWEVILSRLWLVDRIMLSSSQDCDWLLGSWSHAIQTMIGYGTMMSSYRDCNWLCNELSIGHLKLP